MTFFQSLIRPIKNIRKTQQQIAKFFKWVEHIKPIDSFEKLPAPTPPHYDNLENWAAHPEISDKSHFRPEGIAPSENLEADVFFIHPTTFFGNKNWNAPLDHAPSKEFVDEMIIPSQSSVFNGCCRIFAPRYRQATFYSFLEGKKNAKRALELAFSDILRAFDYYIKHHNNGRPFFIAGHSQGALHSVRLMEQRVENTDLFHQFVAGYSVGFRFPNEKFGTDFINLKPGNSANQTQCIVAWDTYSEDGKPANRLEKREHWYRENGGSWKTVAWKTPFGVNPLSWKTNNEKVEATKNLGAVHPIYSGKAFDLNKMYGEEATGVVSSGLSKIYKNEVSAKLKKDGFLYISAPLHKIFKMMLLPRGNYHNYDYSLFYMNIRANIQERLNSFLKNQ